ncbi:hypothetical protein OC845_000614 [Tilletia horrida]|nr:hypothetical protein OC845_000614 [Tilletia horrida]
MQTGYLNPQMSAHHDYLALMRSVPTFSSARMASYDPSETGSDLTTDLAKRTNNLAQPQTQGLYAHQQLQHASFGLQNKENTQPDVDRRASMQSQMKGALQPQNNSHFTASAGHENQMLRAARPQQVSLRQHVLTPNMSSSGFWHAPSTFGVDLTNGPHASNIMSARSSSLPALYGQHYHTNGTFHSPAVSIDSMASFPGPPSTVAEPGHQSSPSLSMYPSEGNAALTGHVMAGQSQGLPPSNPDASFDTSFQSSASSGADASMMSASSANTTLCEPDAYPRYKSDAAFGVPAPPTHEHPVHSGHFPGPFPVYERRDQASHPEHFAPYGGPFFAHGVDGRQFNMEPMDTYMGQPVYEHAPVYFGSGMYDHRQPPGESKVSNRRPTLLASESSNYSIDALLAITRAAEADPTVFPCPFCEKSYEGKHARSIWRRHLQDKHAIPLSAQPRRTRWDSDVNRPKNAEERRQRMLESKRRWAQKRRRQKHLEAEARAAIAAAAAAVEEAEKSHMDSAVIQQMRAWHEETKAQMEKLTTTGALDQPLTGSSTSPLVPGDDTLQEGAEDGDDSDCGDHDSDNDSEEEVPISSSQLNTAYKTGGDTAPKGLTPGRPTIAEKGAISPDSPFTLPEWLNHQPASLRAAAMAALQAQRAQARSDRKHTEGAEGSRSASKRSSASGPSPAKAQDMSRTVSLPGHGDNGSRSAQKKRTNSHPSPIKGPTSAWDPFVVPPVPIRLGATPSEASTEPEVAGPQKNHHRALTGSAGGHTSFVPSEQSSETFHHVGAVDHSPTPAGKRAAAARRSLGHAPVPPNFGCHMGSTANNEVRALNVETKSSFVLGLMGNSASTEERGPSGSSSPSSSGFLNCASRTSPNGKSARQLVPENPFSLDRHKISPIRSRSNTVTNAHKGFQSIGLSHDRLTLDSSAFPMGRHLPALPGLNERGAGDDPMMMPASGPRRSSEAEDLSLALDTPMRLFAGAFAKTEGLPSLDATPRSLSGRRREPSASSAAILGAGSTSVGSGSSVLATGKTSSHPSAPLATPDRFTRPRGLSSAMRRFASTPSAGLKFGSIESPQSALLSIGAGTGLSQATTSASTLLGSVPSSTMKTWGSLSSAMLEWPNAGGVELSPIRARLSLPDRREGSTSAGSWPGSTSLMGRDSKPTSPNSYFALRSGSDSGTGSPTLRPTTSSSLSTSGLSALGTALTRPRGLSRASRENRPAAARTEGSDRAGLKRAWDTDHHSSTLDHNKLDGKRARPA